MDVFENYLSPQTLSHLSRVDVELAELVAHNRGRIFSGEGLPQPTDHARTV